MTPEWILAVCAVLTIAGALVYCCVTELRKYPSFLKSCKKEKNRKVEKTEKVFQNL